MEKCKCGKSATIRLASGAQQCSECFRACALPGPANVDSRPLMRQLCQLANIDLARVSRMVLVLDVDDAPRLHVQTMLCGDGGLDLSGAKVDVVVSDASIVVSAADADCQVFRIGAFPGKAAP